MELCVASKFWVQSRGWPLQAISSHKSNQITSFCFWVLLSSHSRLHWIWCSWGAGNAMCKLNSKNDRHTYCVFLSYPFASTMLFLLLQLYRKAQSQLLPVFWYSFSRLLWLLQILCISLTDFRISLSIFTHIQKPAGILIGIILSIQIWGELPLWQYWVLWNMTWYILSFVSLLWLLSAVYCSFQCISLSCISLKCIPTDFTIFDIPLQIVFKFFIF